MCLMGWIRCRSCTLKVHVSVHTYMCVCVHVCTTDYRQEDYMLRTYVRSMHFAAGAAGGITFAVVWRPFLC